MFHACPKGPIHSAPVRYTQSGHKMAQAVLQLGEKPELNRDNWERFDELANCPQASPGEAVLFRAAMRSSLQLAPQIAQAISTGLDGSLGFVLAHCYQQSVRDSRFCVLFDASRLLKPAMDALAEQTYSPLDQELAKAAVAFETTYEGCVGRGAVQLARESALKFMQSVPSSSDPIQSIAQMALQASQAAFDGSGHTGFLRSDPAQDLRRSSLRSIAANPLAMPEERVLATLGSGPITTHPFAGGHKSKEMLELLSQDREEPTIETIARFTLGPAGSPALTVTPHHRWCLLRNGFSAVIQCPEATPEQLSLAKAGLSQKATGGQVNSDPSLVAGLDLTMEKILASLNPH